MEQPTLLDYASSLTVDDLIRMMPEIEAKFPKDKMPPNPADVHPATFAALQNVCEHTDHEPYLGFMASAITLHVRTDVEPWKLHPCKCIQECSCAQTWYRNNHDGTQDLIKKGQSRCPKCHGSGYVSVCTDCSGAGVVNSAKCAPCGGCGFRSKPVPALGEAGGHAPLGS